MGPRTVIPNRSAGGSENPGIGRVEIGDVTRRGRLRDGGGMRPAVCAGDASPRPYRTRATRSGRRPSRFDRAHARVRPLKPASARTRASSRLAPFPARTRKSGCQSWLAGLLVASPLVTPHALQPRRTGPRDRGPERCLVVRETPRGGDSSASRPCRRSRPSSLRVRSIGRRLRAMMLATTPRAWRSVRASR